MTRRSNPLDPAATWREAVALLTKRLGDGPPWIVGGPIRIEAEEARGRLVLYRGTERVDEAPADAAEALLARGRALVPGRGKPAPKTRRDPGPRLPKVFTVTETNQMSAIDNAAGNYYRDERGVTVWVPKRNVAVLPWFRRTVPLRQDVERSLHDEDAQAIFRAGGTSAHLHIVRWTDPGGGHTETVYIVAPMHAAADVIARYDLVRVSGSGIFGGGRARNPVDDDADALEVLTTAFGRTTLRADPRWRTPGELVALARAAGARGPLAFLGMGMIGVVLGDADGRAYKVARHPNYGASIEAKADWLAAAARVPFVAGQVSPLRAWRPDLLVLVKDRIEGVPGRWADEDRLWDKSAAITDAMRGAGWTGPERKADSWVITPDGRDVLVDAGQAHRRGSVMRAYAEEVLRGERPLAEPGDVATDVAIEASAGTLPRADADRLAAALRGMRKTNCASIVAGAVALGAALPLVPPPGPADVLDPLLLGAIAHRRHNPVLSTTDAQLRADADIARRAGIREVGRLRGACDNVALTLRDRLAKRGIPARVAHGTFRVGGVDRYHVWVDVEGTVIDATIAQYNNAEKGVGFPRLFVGTYREEPRYRLSFVVDP